MKQNDKCECQCHKNIRPFMLCCEKCYKSHSQDLTYLKNNKNVRASGEALANSNKQQTTTSVPYTPLTKKSIFMTPFNNVGFYKEDFILSALNGLRNDLEREYIMDLNGDTTYQHASVLRLISKWFDIEVKQE